MMNAAYHRKGERNRAQPQHQHRQALGNHPSSPSKDSEVKREATNDVETLIRLAGIDDNHESCNSNDNIYVAPICSNIDEAMAALHSSLDGMSRIPETPSSYIPSLDYDWLLDGISTWESDAETSRQLLKALYEPQFESLEQQLVAQTIREQERLDADETDDDDFGDFQSAEMSTPIMVTSQSKPSLNGEQTVSIPVVQEQISELPDPVAASSIENAAMGKEEEETVFNQTDNSVLVEKKVLHITLPEEFDSASTSQQVRLSLRLSITDMSTVESRFVRRLQQKMVADSLDGEEDEDSEFDEDCLELYGNELDETSEVLRRLPWKYVPFWKCGRLLQEDLDVTFLPVMHEHLTTELSTLDSTMKQVTMQLLRQVQPHRAQLEQANEQVHKLNQDMALALLYVNRTKESLRQTRGDPVEFTGLEGSIALLEAWDRRDQHVALDQILAKVARLIEKEKVLLRQIEIFDPTRSTAMDDCRNIVRLIRELYCEANDEPLSKIVALNSLRERTLSAVNLFRDRIHVLLTQVLARSSCQGNFWKDAYETLLLARLDVEQQQILHDHQETDSTTSFTSISGSWTQIVIQSLCHEIDRAFARALLDPSDFRESFYDKELMELSLELNHDGQDSARLRTVTHNLVIIRFNFEAEENYLPLVYRKLCALLTDVLYILYSILQWHNSQCEPINDDDATDSPVSGSLNLSVLLREDIKNGIAAVWKHCEGILTRCLDDYLHIAAKIKFFHGDDDRTWARDLEGLHEVLHLTHQFLTIGRSFFQLFHLQVDATTFSVVPKDETPLQQKLCDVFRRHLRCIHVEAMNNLGAALAREDWKLVQLACKNDFGPIQDSNTAIRRLLTRELKQRTDITLRKFSPSFRRSRFSGEADAGDLFSTYKTQRNPFLRDEAHTHLPEIDLNSKNGTIEFEFTHYEAYRLLGPLFTFSEAELRIRMCKSAVEVLLTWVSRLATASLLVPLIAEDISVVFAHLCDLYLTTVLRLCARNSRSEKIILGVISPNPVVTTARTDPTRSGSMDSNDKPFRTTKLFGFRRKPPPPSKKSTTKPLAMVSANTEADVCSPLPCDMASVAKLRKFIVRGQESLSNVVNFDMVDDWLPDVRLNASESVETSMKSVSRVLEKRVCAALSSVFVAILMDVSRAEIMRQCRGSLLFETSSRGDEQGTGNDKGALAAFCSYVDTLLSVIPKFVDLSTQMSCAHAIQTRMVVSEIIAVGGGWEEAKLNEHPNDYVDDLCQRFSFIWANLQLSNSKLPPEVIRSVWEGLMQAGYLALLEGFSRVSYCSTEGRSLMSMDLAAFISATEPWAVWERLPNHEEFSPPPAVSVKRGMQYVDTYIKVFYFPMEDIKDWIVENCNNYQQNHTVALISSSANSQDRPEIIRFVKNLYLNCATNDEGPPKLCRHTTC